MKLYGRKSCLVFMACLVSAAAPADNSERVGRLYAAQLGRQCPAKHLELLSPADLRDALDSYKGHLSDSTRLAMDRAESRSCRHVTMGASCANIASIEVAAEQQALPALTASICGQFEICRGQSDCDPASARALQQAIRERGAAKTAASLSTADWDIALDEVAAGRTDWIDTVALLREATDASRSEAIDAALSDALLSNPSQVLRLMATRPSFPGVRWLCQDRTIEPTKAESRQHTTTALAAVKSVSDPQLKRVRDECLASLQKASS